MAAVLYFLGLLSIVFGVVSAVDQFNPLIEDIDLKLGMGLAYQAFVGGILLFVMARLLQHAAATARNTEILYQQALQSSETSAATAAASATTAPATAAPEPEAKAPEPEAEEKPVETETSQAQAPATPTDEPTSAPSASAPEEAAPAEVAPAEAAPAETPAAPAAAEDAEPTIVEQIEHEGYMIDKLSNGRIEVHTAEGPMQFENLETFARELELSKN